MRMGVSAKDRSGKSYDVSVVNPLGHAKNPVTARDLATKFTCLCEPMLGKRRTATALSSAAFS